MESYRAERISAKEMVQERQNLSFLGRRSFVPRPLSEATEIFDTDFEDDEDEISPASFDSRSTLSTVQDEAITPPATADLGQYEFHFDQTPVTGPTGPHLFYSKPSKTEEADLVIAWSPVEALPATPSQSSTALNTAVSDLDETRVQTWTPRQVASWMTEAGFDASVAEKFLVHDICGSVLLDLQLHDLKELEITSFGKRHRVMSEIQHLRNNSMFSTEDNLSRRPSTKSQRSSPRPQSSRRGRMTPGASGEVVPEESVSIVAIEQILPRSHKCSKGEACPKWKKQQRKIQKLEEEFATDVKSLVAPSVAASSDVLGASPAFALTSERLSTIKPRDPQESVRQFLDFQHMSPISAARNPSPPPALSAQVADRLHGLPRLQIPVTSSSAESPCRTPISVLQSPTEYQAMLKAELENDPYHYGGVASPVDVFRVGSPMSATDIPVTALPIDPCARNFSQSVPPEMKYGQPTLNTRRTRRPTFLPAVAPVPEVPVSPTAPPTLSEEELVMHAGWMKKRKTARMLRHEWEENYFNLQGNKLDMLANETPSSALLQSIDVDDYVVHAYATASASKLTAALKKSVGGRSTEPAFAFTLIPEQKSHKLFSEKDKTHHFAVDSGKDRVEWMRKLMLAKAMKRNDGQI